MNKTGIKLSVLSAAVALAVSAGTVQAYQTGDMILRAGTATVAPNVDSGKLKNNAGVVDSANPTKVDVNNDTQLGWSLTYMFSDNLGVEVLVATPFSHTIKTKGGLSGLGNLAEVKQLPPTVSLQWYPMASHFQIPALSWCGSELHHVLQ